MKKSTVSLRKVLIINSVNDDEACNINIAWNFACN